MRLRVGWPVLLPMPPSPDEWRADPEAAKARIIAEARAMIRRFRRMALFNAVGAGTFGSWVKDAAAEFPSASSIRLIVLSGLLCLFFCYTLVDLLINEIALHRLMRIINSRESWND